MGAAVFVSTSSIRIAASTANPDWFKVSWREVWDRMRLAPHELPGVIDLRSGDAEVHRSHLPVIGYQVDYAFRTPFVFNRDPILRPHQVEGLQFLISRRGSLLADEPRVGKTVQAIYAHNPNDGIAVVVGPIASRLAWHEWAVRRFGWCSNEDCHLCGTLATKCGVSVTQRPGFHAIEHMKFKPEALLERKPQVVFMSFSTARGWMDLANAMPIGTFILDECFPAGTLVDGRPIETLREGDVVTAFDPVRGVFSSRRIVARRRIRPANLLRVWTAVGCVVCTPRHRFYTNRGWVEARKLRSGDFLFRGDDGKAMESTEGLFNLRGVVAVGVQEDILLSRVQDDRTRACSPRETAADGAKGLFSSLHLVRRRSACGRRAWLGTVANQPARFLFLRARSGISRRSESEAYVTSQSYAGSDGTRANGGYVKSDWAPSADTGRQWASVATRPNAVGQASQFTNRICSNDQNAIAISAALQDRHCRSDTSNRDRNRWGFPRSVDSAGTGYSQDRILGVARVDRVEVLKQTRDGTFGGSCPGGFVYDIEVEDLHTFLADGFVVHNCHLSGVQSRRNITVEALRRLSYTATRVILASGSPMFKGPKGLWPLLDLACPGGFGKFFPFGVRYCAARPGEHGWNYEGSSHEDELSLRLSEVMIRRRWNDIAKDLPPITRTIELVGLTEDQRDEIEAKAAAIQYAGGGNKTVVGDLARLRQLFSAVKVDAALKWIHEEAVLGGRSCIVWTWHRSAAEEISAKVLSKGFNVISLGPIHGQMSTADRERLVIDAHSIGSKQPVVLIATMATAGTGLNLSFASHELFVELDWSPVNVQQAEMRPFNGTQPISATFLVADCRTDQALAAALITKLEVASSLGLQAGVGDARSILRSSFNIESDDTLDALTERLMATVESED